jgi:hypothetical protein
MIATHSGPDPPFDPVLKDFLFRGYDELQERTTQASLLDIASLGRECPWLYRLTFRTRGLIRDDAGRVQTTEHHVVALRFLPDYLRFANQFAMLRLVTPSRRAFHPNVFAGRICVEVYPGEPPLQICESLHDLIRWRLREYREQDALNSMACAWGRENVKEPIDDRSLFGRRLTIDFQTVETGAGEEEA